MTICFFCRKEVNFEDRVSFRELCPHCGVDFHVCRNCGHYDPGRSNKCKEPMAEKVRDDEARNTCEYFIPGDGGPGADDSVAKAKNALDELFKKK